MLRVRTAVTTMALVLAACSLEDAGVVPATDGAVSTVVDAFADTPTPPVDSRPKDGTMGMGEAEGATDGSLDGGDAGDARDANAEDAGDAGCPSVPNCGLPACIEEGFGCVPAFPNSWTLAAVDFDGGSACPTGYGASEPRVTAPDGGAASCTCTCGVVSPPSCETGTLVVIDAPNDTCSGVSHTLAVGDGGCVPATGTAQAFREFESVPAATGGSCLASAETTKPATGSTPASLCPGPATPNVSKDGCLSGFVCTARTPTRSVCVTHGGSKSCPDSYPTAYQLGTSVSDTRSCTPCQCETSPSATCSPGELTYYVGSACTGNYAVVATGTGCNGTGLMNDNYGAYQYVSAAGEVTCGTPTLPPTPSGSATLDSAESVCCLP